jgi:hypothetical protein
MSWLSSGPSHRLFCSSVPYAARISMFPVSGAEHRRRAGVAADHLVEQTQLELPEARAAELLAKENGPQPLVLDLLLELTDVRLYRRVPPPHRVGEDVVERLNLLPAEPPDPVELLLERRIGGEVPCHARAPLS